MEGLNPVYTMFLKIFLESVTKIKIYFWMCSMLLFSHFYFKIYFGAGNFAWDRVLLSYLLLDTQITGKHILRRSHRVREWEVGEITFLPMLGNFNSWARLTCFPWAPPESSTSFQKDVYFCVYVRMCECVCCSVTKSCPTLRDPMDCSMPGSPVPHHLPEFAQVHVHWIGDTIQPSHPLLPSPPGM